MDQLWTDFDARKLRTALCIEGESYELFLYAGTCDISNKSHGHTTVLSYQFSNFF